ncbi:hypothetical protein CZ765_12580 [Corynebacterium casei]|uniref:hypothetical protein n=1 Tax=Corynebacterium casei TaxID=160386 RepID=UPI0009C6BAA6|nr:hypothetical protein [Corynebacterium casei]SLM94196.1 hypothetical protein CZ765_12580 [Corynebacterium casei]
MNDTISRAKPSKRLLFTIGWSVISIAVAVYLAISKDSFIALLVVLTFTPLSVLSVYKMDMLSRQIQRDNAVIKDKSAKAVDTATKSLTEIKAVRSKNKVISARSSRILGNIKRLTESVDGALAQGAADRTQFDSLSSDLQLKSTETKTVTDDLRTEWNEFLSDFARLSHFSSVGHSSLSASQLSESSKLLEEFNVSDVVLIGMEPIPEFDRVLKQGLLEQLADLNAIKPAENKPFVILANLDSLEALCRENMAELETLNAAYIVPQPIANEALDQLGFARIPVEFNTKSVEFICPIAVIGTNKTTAL